jgi:hypothetical protein
VNASDLGELCSGNAARAVETICGVGSAGAVKALGTGSPEAAAGHQR